MKRDMNIVRNILINHDVYEDKELTDLEEVYNLDLLIESEHMKGKKLQDGNEFLYINLNLTEKGYDLLLHISNDTVWQEIKDTLNMHGFTVNDVPSDVLKDLSRQAMKEMFSGEERNSRM